MCTSVRNSGYKHYQSVTMSSFQTEGNTENLLLFVSIHPYLCPPLSLYLSVCPCASAAILPSFLGLPGVLCFFASLLHQLLFLPLLFSYPTTTASGSPHLHRATSPWLHPSSPTATPSFTPLVPMSSCIMPFLIRLSHSLLAGYW